MQGSRRSPRASTPHGVLAAIRELWTREPPATSAVVLTDWSAPHRRWPSTASSIRSEGSTTASQACLRGSTSTPSRRRQRYPQRIQSQRLLTAMPVQQGQQVQAASTGGCSCHRRCRRRHCRRGSTTPSLLEGTQGTRAAETRRAATAACARRCWTCSSTVTHGATVTKHRRAQQRYQQSRCSAPSRAVIVAQSLSFFFRMPPPFLLLQAQREVCVRCHLCVTHWRCCCPRTRMHTRGQATRDSHEMLCGAGLPLLPVLDAPGIIAAAGATAGTRDGDVPRTLTAPLWSPPTAA